VNLLHHWICNSGYWKRTMETELLPWALEGVDLGADVLEIGSGYGVATVILRTRVAHLTALRSTAAWSTRCHAEWCERT